MDTAQLKRSTWYLSLAAVLLVLPYVLFVVVAYYVNDLDQQPLADVAIGFHDPKDLWPTTVPHVGGWLHLFGFMSAIFSPMLLMLAGIGSGVAAAVVARNPTRPRRFVVVYVALTLICSAGVAYFLSPFGQALLGWQLD